MINLILAKNSAVDPLVILVAVVAVLIAAFIVIKIIVSKSAHPQAENGLKALKRLNSSNTWFLMIWGAGFGGIPLAILLLSEAEDRPPVGFFLIFILIGLTVFTIGLINVIKAVSDVALLMKGKDGIGHYQSDTAAFASNKVTYYRLTFSFTNEQGKRILQTTSEVFPYNKVEIFRKSHGFQIKVLGNRACIVPDGVIDYGDDTKTNVCEYCGSLFEGKKCPNCGAPRTFRD